MHTDACKRIDRKSLPVFHEIEYIMEIHIYIQARNYIIYM